MLFAGSLLAYPLSLLFPEAAFHDLAIRATQLAGLLFALAYLHTARPLSRAALGWQSADGNGPLRLLQGFVTGIAVLAALAASLYLLGIHEVIPGRDYSTGAIGLLIVKALITGLAVGLFEETLFRGALLGGLLRRTPSAVTAITVISLVYAAVHFIDYPPLAEGEAAGWLSGPARFAGVLAGLFQPRNLDALLALFMLGVLLGLMRLRDGDILRCIGLHAGVVAMIKVSRYGLAYREGSGLDFLVSAYDHRIGLLAFLWLALATLVYYKRSNENKTANSRSAPG